jgi:hypothetical protein
MLIEGEAYEHKVLVKNMCIIEIAYNTKHLTLLKNISFQIFKTAVIITI